MGKIIINFKTNQAINTGVFYSEIYTEVKRHLNNNSEFIFDFTGISFIHPNVLTKMCALGWILKDNDIKPPEIIFEWNSKIKNYLVNIGFINIVRERKLYYIDERLLGDVEKKMLKGLIFELHKKELIDKYQAEYIFEAHVSEKDRLKFCVENEIIGESNQETEVIEIIKQITNNSYQVNKLAIDFCELIHNALWHGGEYCYFSIQAATYNMEGKNKSRIDFSVSDTGKGLYNSMIKQIENNSNYRVATMSESSFVALKRDKLRKNYYSIIEMVFYRKENLLRGVYHIIENLSKFDDSKIIFQNQNVKIGYNSLEMKKCFVDGSKEDAHNYVKLKYKDIANLESDELGSGFHIEASLYLKEA